MDLWVCVCCFQLRARIKGKILLFGRWLEAQADGKQATAHRVILAGGGQAEQAGLSHTAQEKSRERLDKKSVQHFEWWS